MNIQLSLIDGLAPIDRNIEKYQAHALRKMATNKPTSHLFMHENIQLIHGDCLDVLKTIPDQSIDLVLTDPPYGTTACKWDNIIDFVPMWAELKRVCKPTTAILLFGTEPFSSLLRVSNLKDFRYDWVWEKANGTGFLNAKFQPLRAHENISVFYARKPVFNPQKTKGNKRKQVDRKDINSECYGKAIKRQAYDSDERYPRSIQFFNSDKQKISLHPTQKPVALLEYLIKSYSNPGQVVLDFTMGSGSTGVACQNTGRKFIGIEKEEKYFKIARDRLAEFALAAS